MTTKFDFNLSTKDKISATIGGNRTLFLNPFPYATVPGISQPDHRQLLLY